MVPKNDHGGPISKLLKPPTKAVDKLGSNPLRLGVNNISSDNDEVRAETLKLLEEILEYLGVLIMTLQAAPVNVCNMCDLDQKMLPLFIILERLIIP